jgi:hypothetical protein
MLLLERNKAGDVLKESSDLIDSETINSNQAHGLIISMEEGICMLKSAIDSIERRIKYKRAIEITKQELSKLNNDYDEQNREKTLKEGKVKTLEKDITKIDKYLQDEITKYIESVESKAQKYISKLVAVRKSHLGAQKEQWAKISNRYSKS